MSPTILLELWRGGGTQRTVDGRENQAFRDKKTAPGKINLSQALQDRREHIQGRPSEGNVCAARL